MKTNTRDRIITYINDNGQARAYDLQKALQISNVAIHKQLNKLLQEHMLIRNGKPPFVFYTVPQIHTNIPSYESFSYDIDLDSNERDLLEAHFLYITPEGNLLYGIKGLHYWAAKYQKNKSLQEVAKDYIHTLKEQKTHYTPEGWIDATAKLLDTFKKTPITHLLVEDVYSYKTYGRTKLAKLVMHAKQTGEKVLIDQISDAAKPLIETIIKKYAIEAVAFIPPTIARPVQFMDELQSKLNLQIPEVHLIKVIPGDIAMPQKTLSTMEERVINARYSIFIKNTLEHPYKNLLLIDDVTGSGASFQETAKKLVTKNIGTNSIIAFAFVGNIKGYDVIREM